MDALRALQQAFLGHLLGRETDIAGAIEDTAEASAEQRLNVYGSGYRLRLKEALETDYERLHAYLGDELFDRLTDAYIDRYPSDVFSLRDYGRHMPELLRSLPAFRALPVAHELERIERAFNHSFDAADSPPLDPAALAGLPPDAWPGMRLRFHASLVMLNNEWNSFPIWRALSRGETPPAPEREPTTWLVWRKALVSRYRAPAPAEAAALEVALSGYDFGTLCECLLAFHPEHEVPERAATLLQSWIAEEMLVDIVR